MAYRAYKYTFKLHAAHNLITILTEQQAHYHTFKIVLYIENQGDAFVSYTDIEKLIDDYLKQYETKYLNHTSPFINFNPTVENIGTVFYDQLKQITSAHNLSLLKLEISETPTRVFGISEKIIL